MSRLNPRQRRFSISELPGAESGEVVLVHLYTLSARDAPAFLAAWKEDAAFLMRQPGFISTQLLRASGDSTPYLSRTVWESALAFRLAVERPGFRARLWDFPSSVVTVPHLFREIAASGVCNTEGS